MNWHQHTEDTAHDTPVLIVSTGAERRFSIRELGQPATVRHIVAHHGSLIILSSEANDTHEHRVPKASTVSEPRFALNGKCCDAIDVAGTVTPEPITA